MIWARPASTKRGLSTTSCRRLSTPTATPSSAIAGRAVSISGNAGFSGSLPRRKMGNRGMMNGVGFGNLLITQVHIEASTRVEVSYSYLGYAFAFMTDLPELALEQI